MKNILIATFLFIGVQLYAQNVVIYGTAYSGSFEKNTVNKIYYTTPGKKFSNKKYTLTDVNGKFKFTTTLSKINRDGIQAIIFSADTTANPDGENDCVQKIYIGRLLADENVQPQKDVLVRTDLMLGYHCSSGMYYGAEEDGLGRFIGDYTFTNKDTVAQVAFRDFMYTYYSNLNPKDQFRMNSERGTWTYNSIDKTMTLEVWFRENKDYGLMLNVENVYVFKVTESEGRMQFQSELYQFERK